MYLVVGLRKLSDSGNRTLYVCVKVSCRIDVGGRIFHPFKPLTKERKTVSTLASLGWEPVKITHFPRLELRVVSTTLTRDPLSTGSIAMRRRISPVFIAITLLYNVLVRPSGSLFLHSLKKEIIKC